MTTHLCNAECARKEHRKDGKEGIPLAAILMDHRADTKKKNKNDRMFGEHLLPLMKRVLLVFLVCVILSAMVKRYYNDNGHNGEDGVAPRPFGPCTPEFEEYIRKQQY